MQKGRIRFLEKGEQALLPGWTRFLPAAWRESYTMARRPYRLEEREGFWEGILQTERGKLTEEGWRRGAAALLEEMKGKGVGIVIPPAEGELPRDVLPFAEGRRITAVFAFAGAAEALRRQGKEPAQASYLIAGGEPWLWTQAFASMGNEVNRLGIFTAERRAAARAAERLYEERGLVAEIFFSPKNPYFAQADAVISCGTERRSYEHILKEGCFWLDLAGDRPTLRRLLRLRPDIAAAEGFYFRRRDGEAEMDGQDAEAEGYIDCPAFRSRWQDAETEGVFSELSAQGLRVSGFSALGKRVKIAKR